MKNDQEAGTVAE